MEWYLFEQTHDLYDFYYEKLSNEVLYGGHIGLEEYLMMLSHMDEENMKDWERRMMAEIRELRLIKEDVIALGEHLAEQAKVIVLPEWIQDPQIKQEAYQLLQYARKYETYDMAQTRLIPSPIYRGPDFEERLREIIDVDEMVELENEELRNMANRRIPYAPADLTKKDDDLISKMNLLAKAVEVDEPPLFGVDINEEYLVEESLRANLPTEKRILVDEIFKILWFNNKDPETYTISFWSDYFSISP